MGGDVAGRDATSAEVISVIVLMPDGSLLLSDVIIDEGAAVGFVSIPEVVWPDTNAVLPSIVVRELGAFVLWEAEVPGRELAVMGEDWSDCVIDPGGGGGTGVGVRLVVTIMLARLR